MQHITPTASTSALPPPTTPIYNAPNDVILHLSAARNPPSTPEAAWRDATESCLDWLLSLRPAQRSPKGKEKEIGEDLDLVHWYCTKGEGCWASAVMMVRTLGLKRVGPVDEFRIKLDR